MTYPWTRWTGGAGFWKTVPGPSSVMFFAAVFCLFSALAFIQDGLNQRALTLPQVTLNLVTGGGFPVVWAFVFLRRMFKLIIATALIQAAEIWWRIGFDKGTPLIPYDSALFRQKLTIDAVAGMVLVLGGYAFFVAFVRREGARFFATYTEVKLAGDIHRGLVPKISTRTPQFEFFGVSLPSGEVGGDLVDLVEDGGRWITYVADVSGHGVSAGVLMSMVKSAVRIRLACQNQDVGLLEDLNRVLKPLIDPNMFITFAYASRAGGSDLQYALAGHLPILRFQKSRGQVEELSVANVPLAIKAHQRFDVCTVQFERGDVLAIVTDGLTEVFDSHGRELGLGPLKRILAQNSGEALEDISAAMRTSALNFGKQADDQSVLLVRRTG